MRRPPRDHLGVTVLMDRVAAVAPSVDEASVAGWDAALDDMFAQVVAPAFARREPRLRARAYLRGLVSGLERKNGWTLAEFAGDACPDGMQRLLNAARWDAGWVRDALGRYVAAHLGDPAAVLVADDSGFEKSGVCSAGVQRQYTGTAREDHQLPDRGVPGLRGAGRAAGADRPGAVCAPVMGG